MARSEEKAMTLMNRWVDQRRAVETGAISYSTRPKHAGECSTVREAEHWRFGIVRELSTLIAQIQNAGLGEARIRSLNDDINKLLKTKHAFEMRIKQLGGPDHTRSRVGGSVEISGYRYFGAAKELPGVKEVIKVEEKKEKFVQIDDLLKNLQSDYFGGRDAELGLEAAESAEEQRTFSEAKARREQRVSSGGHNQIDQKSETELEKALLDKKRKLLLDLYNKPQEN